MYGSNPTGYILLEDANDLARWRSAGGVPPYPQWVEWMVERQMEDSINSML